MAKVVKMSYVCCFCGQRVRPINADGGWFRGTESFLCRECVNTVAGDNGYVNGLRTRCHNLEDRCSSLARQLNDSNYRLERSQGIMAEARALEVHMESLGREIDDRKAVIEKLKRHESRHKRASRVLVTALRVVRNDIHEEVSRIDVARMELEAARLASERSKHGMPDPPPPMGIVVASPIAPRESGIYFFWRNGLSHYVGKSIDLSNRVQANHEHFIPGIMASWLPCEKDELDYVENYYIWLCRPAVNYGRARRLKKAMV